MASEKHAEKSRYVSARQLADRWSCAKSTVHRIADRNKFRRFYLGSRDRGMVRYLREEVERYEQSCLA